MSSVSAGGRVRPLFILALLAGVGLAGCLAGDDTVIDPGAEPVRDRMRHDAVTELALLDVPLASELPSYGKVTREWLFSFAKEHHNRITFTPINDWATDALVAELTEAGYEVEVRLYFSEAYPEASPLAPPVGYRAIVATRAGLVEPEKHIGLIAHYDARYSSNEAAYDDGSGVAAVMRLARHFSEVETRKSVTVLLFDAEELGLKASCYFANEVARTGEPRFDIAFGYDMVGINWPGHAWKMYQMMGDEDDIEVLLPLAEHVYRDVLALPEEGVEILTLHDRNSDERRFREVGLPIYRWAGGRNAADYPHYHQPTDTYETMIEYAGGEAAFEAGMDTVLQTSIAMLHAADQWAFPEYALTEQDCSFYGPDDLPV